ncbi:Nudix family hydrolase [Sulfurivermis fontis]|uniref:Nudix family hydrolase n=1 Tax=Sulfurivermis fontis TaxID=1972068 RepID=UPI000FD908FC|nr:Nudix family hydrolase [Sulfurivermis fontis]
MTPVIHVAAAAIIDAAGRVLIARRPLHTHQGGLWEFPGGKLEHGEDVLTALARELHEELGIDVLRARPLISIPYSYPDRRILLDVWRVDAFAGDARGQAGQDIRWVGLDQLAEFSFPPPNRPIITALQLPDRYLITPEPGQIKDWPIFLAHLEQALQRGTSLVQLRARQLDQAGLQLLAPQVLALCRRYRARLLLNAAPSLAAELDMDGVHLNSECAKDCVQRPVAGKRWLVGVSCHTAEELAHACKMDADFALLSPVQPTASHPGVPALGWDVFARLVAATTIPVYALGGMRVVDIPTAWQHGGQGIAAINGLW